MLTVVARSTSPVPVVEDVELPAVAADEVRVRVAAAAINPVDLGVASGPLQAALGLPDPAGLGWDVSGIVVEVGAAVDDLAAGDRVAGIVHVIDRKVTVGAHAEETVLPAAALARVPAGLDLVDAAALPLNALTARQALDLLGPAEGRRLLVTGAAGAVGGYALVLAARRGWRVTGLAREGDADFVRSTGAELVTEAPTAAFDAVLDSAVLLDAALAAVRDGGAYVGVAPDAPMASERGIATQTILSQPDPTVLDEVLGLAAEGALEMRVAGRAPLGDAAEAYARVARGGQRGRWLLVP